MSIKQILETILERYSVEKLKPFSGNEFASWFRQEIPKSLTPLLDRADLKVKASVGQINWADVPWIGVFNPVISDSATHGFYVVYLFAPRGDAVFLCMGQGVTSLTKEFGRNFKEEVLSRARLMRSRTPEYSKKFSDGPIQLVDATTPLARNYALAPSWFRKYDIYEMPDEKELISDLREAVRLFDLLVERGGTDNLETAMDLEDVVPDTVEEKLKLKLHRRVERSAKISNEVKRIKGSKCEACGFDFGEVFGDRGIGYIEAHHLVPLAQLSEGQSRTLDLRKDFAVLCANCHRIVHRGKTLLELRELRELPGVKRLRSKLRNGKD